MRYGQALIAKSRENGGRFGAVPGPQLTGRGARPVQERVRVRPSAATRRGTGFQPVAPQVRNQDGRATEPSRAAKKFGKSSTARQRRNQNCRAQRRWAWAERRSALQPRGRDAHATAGKMPALQNLRGARRFCGTAILAVCGHGLEARATFGCGRRPRDVKMDYS